MPSGGKNAKAISVGGLSPADQSKIDDLPYKHMVVASVDTILIDGSLASPSYFTGLFGIGSNNPGFVPTLTGPSADQDTGAILNNTGKVLNMTGVIGVEGATGGFTSTVAVWSEFSSDGITWTPQTNSARDWPLSFASGGSQTNFSGVVGWQPGDLLRFAFAINAGSDVTLDPESFTVNGSQIVDGFSVVWTLDEKQSGD